MQKTTKKRVLIVVIILIIILIGLYANFFVAPLVSTLASEEIKAEVVNILNLANDKLSILPIFYADFFEITYTDDFTVSAIASNSGLINQINSLLQTKVQEQLNFLRTKNLSMPLGAFTGSSLLSQFGILVPINAKTVCNCYTKVEGLFDSVGINQVRHRLMITLYVDIEVLIPIKTEKMRVFNDILLAENIIVGKVPSTLLSGNGVTEYLDLLP